MAKQTFQEKIKQVNHRLKTAKLGVTILQRGNRLYIRGTFPPKPGSPKTTAHQQDLALKIYANPQGLQQAEKEAKKIGAALAQKEFDWAEYIPIAIPQLDKKLVADCIAAYETDYFQRRRRCPKTESTWRSNYATYFRRLPQDYPLTLEVLEKVILTTAPDSFPRLGICYAFSKLAEFMSLSTRPIERLKGTYSQQPKTLRKLPSDEDVVYWFNQIPDPTWKWVYGMLATYGLRPHEIFYLNTKDLEDGEITISVLPDTKTGARLVFPLHEKWIDLFNLREPKSLTPEGENNSVRGNKISTYFRETGIPFPPYNLRHAWAVRACQLKIEVSLAARWMGHGVDVHTKTYQKWMSPEVERQMYDEMLQSQRMSASGTAVNQPQMDPQPQLTAPIELPNRLQLSPIEVKADQETTVPHKLETQSLSDVPVAAPKKKKRKHLLTTDGDFQQLNLWAG